ncbi:MULTISPECIES: hypothetical protein [unclassified Agrococcus]|uniref:hypothetical protein n=1 Tax=unclassified Agrococcus TaxID=2615065 RepID=UPI0036207848
MPRPRALAIALAAAGTLVLAACAPGALDGEPSPSPSTSAPETPIPSASPSVPDPNPSDFEPAPSEPPVVAPVDGALDLACPDVLTPDQVYEISPELLATASPTAGIPADFAPYSDSGVVCAWQHVTSGDVLLVGVLEAAGDAPAVSTLPGGAAVVGAWAIAVGSEYFEGDAPAADALIQQIGANLG